MDRDWPDYRGRESTSRAEDYRVPSRLNRRRHYQQLHLPSPPPPKAHNLQTCLPSELPPNRCAAVSLPNGQPPPTSRSLANRSSSRGQPALDLADRLPEIRRSSRRLSHADEVIAPPACKSPADCNCS